MAQIAPYVQILAAAIAVIAFLSGLWQFRKTQLLTREVKAMELFLKFNELNQQLADADGTQSEISVFWRKNALVAITEAVFNLTQGNKYWESTVRWMFEAQNEFLAAQPLDCSTFSPEFIKLMKEAVPNVRCK